MTAADAGKVLLVLVVTAATYGGLRVLQVRARPAPELVRKLFHISGGLLALSFPWLFDDFFPVLVLGVIVTAALVALRLVPNLRSGLGQVLFSVQRESIGELCYIASVVLLFWLAGNDRLLYSVPVLVLALADTFAALIGEQYGKLPLTITGGTKSHEGALAFFLTAFFCVHVPVLLWGGTGRLESLLIGVDLSLLAMMAEAAAWWGLDNLIIPIWGYMMLKSLLEMDSPQLATHMVVVLVMSLTVRFWRNRTTLGDDALFGAILWGYVVWVVGGWRWVIPPAIQLLTYATITARTPVSQQRVFRFPAVLANISGAFFWLLVFRQSGEAAMFFPFAACFGANVAIIALVRQKAAFPETGWRKALSVNAAKGMVVVVPAILVMEGLSWSTLLDLGAALLAVYAATAAFYRLKPAVPDFTEDAGQWARQSAVVAVTSTLAIGIRYGVLRNVSLIDVLNPLNFI